MKTARNDLVEGNLGCGQGDRSDGNECEETILVLSWSDVMVVGVPMQGNIGDGGEE